ncbi:MAG: tail completion protein gp17 [Planctomycetota bacterium]|jgi:hypothetical protein
MSFADVISAIQTRWTDQSLDDTVAGGLHTDESPKGGTLPWAVLTDLGASPVARTSGSTDNNASHYRSRQVQIRIHNNTGASALAVLADAVHAALEYAPLSLSGGALMYCRLNADIFTDDLEHENGRMWAGTYDVLYGVEQAVAPV